MQSTGAHTHKRSDSTQGLLLQSKRESYRSHRDTPFQRCQQLSSTALSTKTSASSLDSSHQHSTQHSPAVEQLPYRPPISRGSSSSSLRKQAQETRAPSAERNRLTRKRSLQSVRKSSTDVGDGTVDREILELNTIVEERRAELPRPQSPPTQHIAAIAPTMAMRARSETLDAIGSALARPLTARDATHIAEVFDPPPKRARPSTARTSTRVSGWLSGLLPAISTTTQSAAQEPFYQCKLPALRRTHSEASIRTSTASVTELDSPSLTAASSPTTKGHSRSLTAESRLTPISPPSTVYDYEMNENKKDAEEHWPLSTSRSQVGLAF